MSKTRRGGTPSKYVSSSSGNSGWIWGILVVVVVAIIVAVSIAVSVVKKSDGGDDGSHVKVTNATVTVSEEAIEFRPNTATDATPVVEIFSDPRCPICALMEKQQGKDIAAAISDGVMIVRYHLMDFLNVQGATQYSTRANAALLRLAATGDAEATYRFYSILYHNAPEEGMEHHEWTNAELADFARTAKAPSEVVEDIRAGRVDTFAASALAQKNMTDLNKRMKGQAGTPAVFVNGKQVDAQTNAWISKVNHAS